MLSDLLWRVAGSPDSIALVTANFGGIDIAKPLPPHQGIDAFYYTDAEGAASVTDEVARTWTRIVVPDYPRHDFSPRLRGRYFKHQIHRLDEVRRHRWLAWADSSLQFKDLGFLRAQAARLARLPARKRVLLVPHPDRRTVMEEFRFIQGEMDGGNAYLRQRYLQEHMPEQMRYFAARGWSAEEPLYCGTFWMVENSASVRAAWDDWWDQNLRFGLMDQLSLPVLLAHHRIAPQVLGVHLWNNEHFEYVSHARR